MVKLKKLNKLVVMILTFAIITSIILPGNLVKAAISPSPHTISSGEVVLFMDKFDSGKILTPPWVQETSTPATISSSTNSSMTPYRAKIVLGSSLVLPIDTTGYENIKLYFSSSAGSTVKPGSVIAEYTVDDGAPLPLDSFTMSGSTVVTRMKNMSNASHSTNVKVRFKPSDDMDSACSLYIDNVMITGTPIPTTVSIDDASDVILKVDKTKQLSATVSPAQNIHWESDDITVASIDASGLITAEGIGTTKVRAYVMRGTEKIVSQDCTVNVTKPTTISLKPPSVSMFVGESMTVTATIEPVSDAGMPVTWYTGDEDVATVDNGKINGIAVGNTQIWASVTDTVAVAVYCDVTVKELPKDLTVAMTPPNITMSVNDTTQIKAQVYNASTNDASVSWHTYDTTVVSLVDGTSINTLTIKAVGAGDAKIYASVTDAVYGSAYAVCEVHVNPMPLTISIVPASISMRAGESKQLSANVSDAGKTVTWSTYNSSVATVDTTGLVKAISAGSAVIRASVSESVYAECNVTVNSADPYSYGQFIPPVNSNSNSNINIPVLLEQISNTKGTELTINVPGTGKTIQVTLPVNVFDKIKAKGIEKIQLSSATVSMTLSPDAFDTKNISSVTVDAKQADKSKDLTPAQQKIVGDNQVYDFAISVKKSDGTEAKISKFNKPVEVSIPYILKNGEDPRKITVFFIGENGELENRAGKYDSATGKVTFSTNHFSKYFVKYNDVSFTDLGNVSWAKEQIEVMASKGIINGTGSSNFSPEKNITRADFLMLLVNTLGLTANVDSNFSDVKSTDYYYDAVGIAKKLGLTNGTGSNTFEPQKEISREDMMSLVARAMKLANKLGTTGSTADLQIFKDKNNISDYAAVNVATLVKEGIIKGNGVNIEPKQSTTRAEAAVLLYRIYTK